MFTSDYTSEDGGPTTIFFAFTEASYYGYGTAGRRLQEEAVTLCDDFLARALSATFPAILCPSGEENIVVDQQCVDAVQRDAEALYNAAVEEAEMEFATANQETLKEMTSTIRRNIIGIRARDRARSSTRTVRSVRESINYLVASDLVPKEVVSRETVLTKREEAIERASCEPLVKEVSSCLGCSPCSIIDPRTQCCSNADCPSTEACVANVCVSLGNPRFELRWFGDGE